MQTTTFFKLNNEIYTYILIKYLQTALKTVYWVPQNSRNNSMRQCQLMLENNVKNNKKNSIPLRFEDNGGSKDAALISFILNIKEDFDYLSFTSQ
jgi:hypothetical protein